MRPSGPALTRSRDAIVAGSLALAAGGLAWGSAFNRPDLYLNERFLFKDAGHNLLIAQSLLSGRTLYGEVFSQYGPLPAYAHALFASLGNTPGTYLTYLALVSCLNVVLVYALARRVAREPIAAAVTGAFIVSSIEPGSLLGGYTDAAYIPLERMVLLLVALGWRAPDVRSIRRSLLVGCLLGAWQGVRFGGTFFGGAAIVVIDAAYLMSAGWSMERGRAWIKSLVAIGAGFAAIELIWVIWAFSSLSPELAVDVVWPRYMLTQYESWVTAENRWIGWIGWPAMITQYLMPASAGLIGAVGLGRWLKERDPRSADAGAVFVPLCFFILAAFFYFRMVHHFRQFMWTLVPAAAWELERRGTAMRAPIAAAWAPGFAMLLRSALIPAAVGPLIAVSLPSGGTIYPPRDIVERIQFLQRFTSTEAPGSPVLFIGAASGWLYTFRVPYETRHTWVWAPEIVRPYEEEEFVAALDRTAAMIECDGVGLPGSPPLPFPPRVADAIRSRLTPWTSGGGCRAYHIQPR